MSGRMFIHSHRKESACNLQLLETRLLPAVALKQVQSNISEGETHAWQLLTHWRSIPDLLVGSADIYWKIPLKFV